MHFSHHNSYVITYATASVGSEISIESKIDLPFVIKKTKYSSLKPAPAMSCYTSNCDGRRSIAGP
uniref:Uncharacterized protein n=1 Tax=Romanomermis culicivorax TaxID=13658 RepID=A0A915INF6_ROMCU